MAFIGDTKNISFTFVHHGWKIRDPNPYRDKKFCTFSRTSKCSLAHLHFLLSGQWGSFRGKAEGV